MRLASLRITLSLLLSAGTAFAQTCPPASADTAALRALKAAHWKLDDTAQREALASALVSCLASPDPELRDGIAFEALNTWLRGRQLSPSLQTSLYQRLLPQLQADASDPTGFGKPFAALALSELARADRIAPFLTADDRAALVNSAIQYLRGVTDYRGFAAGEGWRHGVAHGADLLMQLALNPVVDRTQLERMTTAVQSQIAPANGHFYIFGESERLARPVLFVARRNVLDAGWWRLWVQTIALPAPFPTWEKAFESTVGLSRLHNTKAFLLALYLNAQEGKSDALQAVLLPPVREALLGLP